MILDLYARLEQRHWLDLAKLPLLVVLTFAFFLLGAATGHAAGFRFTETTGRAVIMDSAMEPKPACWRLRMLSISRHWRVAHRSMAIPP